MAGVAAAAKVPEVVERALGAGTFSVEKFVESFPVLVKAAEGIEELRCMVLQLGVAGALTTDRGRICTKAGDGSAEGADTPFPLPEGWTWGQLGDIAEFINGDRSKNYPSKQHQVAAGIPFINAGHLRNGAIDHADMNYITKERFEILRSGKVQTGDVLYCLRGSLGKSALVTNVPQGAIASSLVILRSQPTRCFPAYLLKYFGTPLATQLIRKYDNGTAQPNLSAADVAKFDIPLPPLAEQKRIVARVDQLMALIDQLEAKQNRKRDLGARFTKASLKALTTAESPQDFTTACKAAFENWRTIVDRPEKVDVLRGSVRALAVSAWGDSIASSNWAKVALADVCTMITDGDHNPPQRTAAGIPHVTAKNIRSGRINFDGCTFISSESFAKSSRRYASLPGDVVLTCVGTLGRTAIVADEVFSADRNLAILRPDRAICTPDYLKLLLDGPGIQKLIATVSGSTAQPHIYLGDIRALEVTLPPLAEQKRTVAKVEHLMKLCDALEAALRRSEDRAAKLAEAVVQEMVA